MSCEENRNRYFTAQAALLAPALGTDPAGATQLLTTVFEQGRGQWADLGRPGPTDPRRVEAEAATRAVFSEIQQMGLRPPVHSPSGLPKPDAQFGYREVRTTLTAAREGRPLPPLARGALEQQATRRRLSAVQQDRCGRYRCRMCGRYANLSAHTCPRTATAATMGRALERRLGVAPAAYTTPDGQLQGLEVLLDAARQPDAHGLVDLVHGLTGERVEATLDGVLVALQQGYVPTVWQPQARPVELNDGRIVAVLNDQHLRPAALGSGGALQQAAAAYGVVLPPGASVVQAGAPGAAPPVPVGFNTHPTTVDPPPPGTNGTYDLGRFTGSEYRKGQAGDPVPVDGQMLALKALSRDPADWSSARAHHGGGYPDPPQGGVRVGRTLPEAMSLLRTGVITEDPATGLIEVYDTYPSGPLLGQARRLRGVYDPAIQTAGDTDGQPNASPDQMAAVLAYYDRHADLANPYQAAWHRDLAAYRAGTGRPLQAADSGYLVLRHEFEGGEQYTLGGQVQTRRCPHCGQPAGSQHVCDQAPAPLPPISGAPMGPPAAAEGPAGSALEPGGAVALEGAERPPHETGRTDEPGDTLTEKDRPPAVGPDPAVTQALLQVSEQIGQLTQLQQHVLRRRRRPKAADAAPAAPIDAVPPTGALDRVAAAFERLVTRLEALPGMETGMGTVAAPPAPRPAAAAGLSVANAGSPRPVTPRPPRRPPDDPDRQPVEHIYARIEPPGPSDPYLRALPTELGGQLTEPIPFYYQDVDPSFDVNAQNEPALARVASFLRAAWTPGTHPRGAQGRSFLFYGPPGTGKNSAARQIAAALALPYREFTVNEKTRLQDLIGSVELTEGPQGGTVSRARLGPLGLALATGQVVCLNELQKLGKNSQSILQPILEDGYIEIDGGSEVGPFQIPVHPNTVFIATMNQGVEGGVDRPEAAPLARMIPCRIDEPGVHEEARRVLGNLRALYGQAPDDTGATAKEARRQEILARNYQNRPVQVTLEDVEAATGFFRAVRQLAADRAIGRRSPSVVAPGGRELERFVHTLAVTDDLEAALGQLDIYCDSGPTHKEQWELIQAQATLFYGADGRARSRPTPVQV